MKHEILQGLLYILFQKSAACLQYTIYIYTVDVQTMFHCLGI